MRIAQLGFLLGIVLMSVGCAIKQTKPVAAPATPATAQCECPSEKAVQLPETKPQESKPVEVKPAEPKMPEYSLLKPAQWEDVDGLQIDNLSQAWPGWLLSCSTLVNKSAWKNACSAAIQLNEQTAKTPDNSQIQQYFKQYFSVYKANNLDGSDTGMITGYYEPLLKGSRTKSAKYPNPLYAPRKT